MHGPLTVVLIDADTRKPIAVPDDYRQAVAAFEGDGLGERLDLG